MPAAPRADQRIPPVMSLLLVCVPPASEGDRTHTAECGAPRAVPHKYYRATCDEKRMKRGYSSSFGSKAQRRRVTCPHPERLVSGRAQVCTQPPGQLRPLESGGGREGFPPSTSSLFIDRGEPPPQAAGVSGTPLLSPCLVPAAGQRSLHGAFAITTSSFVFCCHVVPVGKSTPCGSVTHRKARPFSSWLADQVLGTSGR